MTGERSVNLGDRHLSQREQEEETLATWFRSNNSLTRALHEMSNAAAIAPPPAFDPKERRAEIMALREAGMTYRKIGERFGISGSRARQMMERGLRERDHAAYAESRRLKAEEMNAEANQQQALRTISRSLRAELLTRRALAAWSALGSQEGNTP